MTDSETMKASISIGARKSIKVIFSVAKALVWFFINQVATFSSVFGI